MSPLDIAKAGEASDEFLRYLVEQEMLNSYLEAWLFSAEKQKGKINQQDVKKIKDLICSYENVSMKMLRRFGLM